MARNFVFGKLPTDAVELPLTSGSVQFGNGAEIDEYRFDGSDTFYLTVNGWWFDAEGVDDLISFLTAAKARLE